MAADIGERASLQQQALVAQLVVQVGDAGGAQHRQSPIGLAIHQIDDGKSRRDLRTRRTLQPMIDLILQKLGRLIEQIDRDQAVGEPADHLVAAAADRGQFAEIVEQSERIDRRQSVALSRQETDRRRSPPPRPGCAASTPSSDAPQARCA